MKRTKSKHSITDLADKLKISKTTVSFILNGKAKEKRISDELVAKVLKLVEKTGYRPNQFAQSLRTGRTNIIGLMVENISNPFYASIAREIEEKVYLNGYKIVYCSTENDKNRGQEFLRMFTTLGVDGCIIAPTMGMEEDIQELIDNGMSIVLFDRKFGRTDADTVMVNNIEGMYGAVRHLVQKKYKHIALVALALGDPDKEERIIGYKKAITDHKLTPYVFPVPFKVDRREYVEDVKKILKDNKKLDGIIFGTNYLGISGLEAISELDLKIPEDIGIISFDDHDLFRIHKPGITVIAQPIEEIAQTAIETLLHKLRNKDVKEKGRVITLATTLIERGSA